MVVTSSHSAPATEGEEGEGGDEACGGEVEIGVVYLSVSTTPKSWGSARYFGFNTQQRTPRLNNKQ